MKKLWNTKMSSRKMRRKRRKGDEEDEMVNREGRGDR